MKKLAQTSKIFAIFLATSLCFSSLAQETATTKTQPSSHNETKSSSKPNLNTEELSKKTIKSDASESKESDASKLNSDDFRLGRSSEDTRSNPPDAAVGLAKACGSLAIILIVIMTIYYFLRKFSKQIGIQSKDNPIRIHSKQMLDAKTSLYLIRVYEDEFLISVGPNGSNNIARYALIGEDGKTEDSNNRPQFREFLNETVGEDIKPAGVSN